MIRATPPVVFHRTIFRIFLILSLNTQVFFFVFFAKLIRNKTAIVVDSFYFFLLVSELCSQLAVFGLMCS